MKPRCCHSPGCPLSARLSGKCEAHYWRDCANQTQDEADRLRTGILAAIERVNANAEDGDSAGEMLGSLLFDLSALVGVSTGKESR